MHGFVGRFGGCRFKVWGLEVCECGSVTRFLKFLVVRAGFKLCGAGAGKNYQPVQDSSEHKLPTEKQLYDVTGVRFNVYLSVLFTKYKIANECPRT